MGAEMYMMLLNILIYGLGSVAGFFRCWHPR
jgi:hypothetical protein